MSMTSKAMEKYRDKITDPRTDLSEDSTKWQNLLILAWMKWTINDREFYENLRAMRQCGTLIVDNGRGGYRLAPLIDDRRGFFPGEYETMRDKFFDRERKIRVGELLLMLKNMEGMKE